MDVSPILIVRGVWTSDWGAAIWTTLHLCEPESFPCCRSWVTFVACCKCISMVSLERLWEQFAKLSTTSALKMFPATSKIACWYKFRTCNIQDTTNCDIYFKKYLRPHLKWNFMGQKTYAKTRPSWCWDRKIDQFHDCWWSDFLYCRAIGRYNSQISNISRTQSPT